MSHELPHDSNNSSESALFAALADVEAAMQREVTAANVVAPNMRRLHRVLDELGLPVPDDWVSIDTDADGRPTAAHFASMSWKSLDRMLCLLEDLAAGRPVTVVRPMGGPTLFDMGPAAGPTPSPRPNGLHMAVPS